MDSDDTVEPQAFALMYQEAVKQDADIVCADHRYVIRDEINYSQGFVGTDINDHISVLCSRTFLLPGISYIGYCYLSILVFRLLSLRM